MLDRLRLSNALAVGQDQSMIETRAVRPGDHAEIARLLVAAFASPAEASLVDRLRGEGLVAAEVVVTVSGAIVSHALCSWMDAPRGWVALAPVATFPDRQGQGYGGLAIRGVVAAAEGAAARAAVVLGAPELYGRFGFSKADATAMRSPYPLDYTAVNDFGTPLTDSERHAELVYAAAFR